MTNHDKPIEQDGLYFLARAPDPATVNWRAEYARLYDDAKTATFDCDKKIAALMARIAELEAAANPLASIIAAAAELAELTGESCHVSCSAWRHPAATHMNNAEWTAYRAGQTPASYKGMTREEAVAKVRADWAASRASDPTRWFSATGEPTDA